MAVVYVPIHPKLIDEQERMWNSIPDTHPAPLPAGPELLQGKPVHSSAQILSLYHLGSFRYQVKTADGAEPVQVCDTPTARDNLAERVGMQGVKVVVEVPRR